MTEKDIHQGSQSCWDVVRPLALEHCENFLKISLIKQVRLVGTKPGLPFIVGNTKDAIKCIQTDETLET